MKVRYLLYATCICFVIAMGFLRMNPQPAPQVVTPPSLKQTLRNIKPKVLEPAVSKPKTHTPTQKEQMSTSFVPAIPRKPQGNIIEFQIVDGYAVAYGDILLGKPEDPMNSGRGRYEAPTPQHWDKPEIPYSIHPSLPDPDRVEKALAFLREKTPVNFIPYTGQRDAIIFEPGTQHCLSLLGKVGGIQPIKLSPGCQWQQILHEVLHALGFIHEQSRPDRDQYIEILWNNIDEPYYDQFGYVPESFSDPIRAFPFDYQSIMLYPTHSFTKSPDLLNMRPLGSESIAPNQNGLSEGDIKRINRMFRGYD